MASTNNISIVVEAQIANFLTQINEAADATAGAAAKVAPALDQMANQSETATERTGKAFEDLANMAVESLSRIVEYGAELAEAAATTLKMSKSLGMSSDAYQAMGAAAEQAGVDQRTMQESLSRVAETAQDAAAGISGPGVKAFAALKVSVTDAHGKMLPMDDLLPQVAQHLLAVHSPSERLALGIQIFGRNFAQVQPILADVAQRGLPTLTNEAKRSGDILGGEVLDKATQLDNEFAHLTREIKNELTAAVVALGPTILKVAKDIEEAMEGLRVLQDGGIKIDLAGLSKDKLETKKENLTGAVAKVQAEVKKLDTWSNNAPHFFDNALDEKRRLLAQLQLELQQVNAAIAQASVPAPRRGPAVTDPDAANNQYRPPKTTVEPQLSNSQSEQKLAMQLFQQTPTVAEVEEAKRQEALRSLDVTKATAAAEIAAAKSGVEARYNKGDLNEVQKLQASKALSEVEYQDNRKDLVDKRTEAAPDPKAYAKYTAEIEALDQHHAAEVAQTDSKIRSINETTWHSAARGLDSAFKTAFSAITSGSKNLGSSFAQLGLQIAESVGGGAVQAGFSKLFGLQDEGKLKAAEGAAANTYQSVSAIPYVGWLLAPVAAAAAFAAVMAFEKGGIVPSAAGGMVAPEFAFAGGGYAAILHPKEMVLPRHLSEGIQTAIRGGGFGGGDTYHYHVNPTINIQAIDTKDLKARTAQLQDHFADLMANAVRDGHRRLNKAIRRDGTR